MEKITTAASVSAAWRGMSDEEQYTAMQKMAWTVRRGGSKRGAEWIQTQDDAMTVAAEAWLRMGAALERNERADEPLFQRHGQPDHGRRRNDGSF